MSQSRHIHGQRFMALEKRRTFVLAAVCLSLCLTLGFGPGSQVAAAAPAPASAASEAAPGKALANPQESSRILDIWNEQGRKYVFVPADRNDPFLPIISPEGPEITSAKKPGKPLTPLQKMELSSLKLVAIISNGKDARALLEDSTGMGYIIKAGTYVGTNDGKVLGIYPAETGVRGGLQEVVKPGRIEVIEEYRTYLGKKKTRVVTIPLKGEEQ
ncbi:MAG: pilus assembly protein PilP [Deltaproteobacteria bacterium]|nr:pilus assembly protein PilP [Deltaproteobacteria bacterium]MBW2085755.1 pilus assembly protein PilP [Deltaproteobacteria bacterium]